MKSKKLGVKPTHLSTRGPFADSALQRAGSQDQQRDYSGPDCNFQLRLSNDGALISTRNSLETTVSMQQGVSGHFVIRGHIGLLIYMLN